MCEPQQTSKPTEAMSFQCSPALRKAIEDQATKEERTMSGFLRFHLSELLGVTDSDEQPQPPTR